MHVSWKHPLLRKRSQHGNNCSVIIQKTFAFVYEIFVSKYTLPKDLFDAVKYKMHGSKLMIEISLTSASDIIGIEMVHDVKSPALFATTLSAANYPHGREFPTHV